MVVPHYQLDEEEIALMFCISLMAEVCMYDPAMLIWVNESGCDRCDNICKYGYSIRGFLLPHDGLRHCPL